MREDAIGFFGTDVGDQPVGNGNQQPIDLDGDDGGVSASTDTRGTSATASGKRVSAVWEWFDEIKDGKLRTSAICKHCGTRYSARSTGGTGHLIRHMKSCMKKQKHATMVQSRLALNPDGLKNWRYDPAVARSELCRLIAKLDLPLSIGDTQAWEDYIKRAHNPCHRCRRQVGPGRHDPRHRPRRCPGRWSGRPGPRVCGRPRLGARARCGRCPGPSDRRSGAAPRRPCLT